MCIYQRATKDKIGFYEAWSVREWLDSVHRSLKTTSIGPHLILWLEKYYGKWTHLNNLHVGGKHYSVSLFSPLPLPNELFLHPSVLIRQLLKFLFMLWLPQELIFVILFYSLPLPGYFEVATYSEFSGCFKPGSFLLLLFRLPLVTPSIKHDCSSDFNFYLLCHRTTFLVLSLSSVGSVRSSE